jgi:hypothetical protein
MGEENQKSVVKPLVEGIVSLVLAATSFVWPAVVGVTTFAYKVAANGEAVCKVTSSETTRACTQEEIQNLQIGLRAVAIAMLVLAILFLGASIILGVFAHKNGVAAGNEGKARAGAITGMIGWILAAFLLLLTLVFVILAFVALK